MKPSFFLSAKPWQIFLITCIPIFTFMLLLSSPLDAGNNAYYLIATFQFSIIVFLYWLKSIGLKLSAKLPATQSFDILGFKILIYYAITYMVVTSVLLLLMSVDIKIAVKIYSFISLSLLLPLFFLFALIHSIYDAAKILKAVELRKKVNFLDFIGEFLSFCFFPIGIWFLQASINRIYEMNASDDLMNHLVE